MYIGIEQVSVEARAILCICYVYKNYCKYFLITKITNDNECLYKHLFITSNNSKLNNNNHSMYYVDHIIIQYMIKLTIEKNKS